MAASSLRVAIGPVSDPDGPSSPLLEDSELLAEVAVSQIADHPERPIIRPGRLEGPDVMNRRQDQRAGPRSYAATAAPVTDCDAHGPPLAKDTTGAAASGYSLTDPVARSAPGP